MLPQRRSLRAGLGPSAACALLRGPGEQRDGDSTPPQTDVFRGLESGWGLWLIAQSEKFCGTPGQSCSLSPAEGCRDQALPQK